MSISWVDILLLLVTVCAVLAAVLIRPRPKAKKRPIKGGQRIEWHIDKGRSTEIISNEWLGKLQRSEEHGGILRQYDLVVVWAKEFLDYDILYDVVRDNIRDLIRYVYVLDRRHAVDFRKLVQALKKEKRLDAKLVEDAIDVILVPSEHVLSNFVLLAAGTDHQRMYSAIIYDERPFAWILQDHYRAHQFLTSTQNLAKAVGAAWYDKTYETDELRHLVSQVNRVFEIEDQIMDFTEVGRILKESVLPHLEDIPMDLRDMVTRTTMPADVDKRLDEVIAKGDREDARRAAAGSA